MSIPSDSVLISSAASARAIAGLYGVALLTTILMIVAAAAAWVLRRSSAGIRALVWRSALLALLVVLVGQATPLHWIAWVVPDLLAMPLIALGRVQVTAPSMQAASATLGGESVAGIILLALLALYSIGVIVMLTPLLVAVRRMRQIVNRAHPARDANWRMLIADAGRLVGVRRRARVVISDEVPVAITWGVLRPIIALPASVETWDAEHRRIVLVHEFVHVRAADWFFAIMARLVRALLWFHPGAWLVADRLREEAELACDERVLSAGIRRSDYAELLVAVAERLHSVGVLGAAPAFARRRGLRGRVHAILDDNRRGVPLARRHVMLTFGLTLAAIAPMSTAQLAPTRAVLTTLMLDAKWESRAYAVLGLAQRADSVAVARSAAESDPNPRVRAWAQYALSTGPGRSVSPTGAGDLDAIIRKH